MAGDILREGIYLTGGAAMLFGLDEYLAQELQKAGTLCCFGYVSTAYVNGSCKGRVYEDGSVAGTFNTLYEESKAQAEGLVRSSGLPYQIYRPSMIVGDSLTGKIRTFNTVYYVLKLMLRNQLPFMPTARSQKLNLIPVDEVAQAISALLLHEEATGGTYHLTAEDTMCPTAGELADAVQQWAKEHLGRRRKPYVWMKLPVLAKVGRRYNMLPAQRKKNTLSNMLALSPYFYCEAVFDRTGTNNVLGRSKALKQRYWRAYLPVLLQYALRRNFLHGTERNVFEQARYRRNSKTAPVTYHDVTADGITELSGQQLNKRVEDIQKGLMALGIRQGDRVAVAAVNCTDYVALDMAIGLAGAVSVPIYYTTPVHEIDGLLEQSGASCFFVGDKRIGCGLSSLAFAGPVVVFANAESLPEAKGHAQTWQEFLRAGAPYTAEDARTDWNDIATIRYTSGTTGTPKGVLFRHSQLSWMGEVMTYLIDWNTRQKPMRYMSFLPMSHVVEGILATYAPYYMSGRVDLYYLNDFDALTDALPKVRPTVFFSVPRFYEKLWQQLEATDAGKRYIAMKPGIKKSVYGKIVKQVLLKKAGLDSCGQLIVGSAPMSLELMEKFRRLGIEIYNAYGQTEAPLITINRMGDNVLSSIGTPLPDTEVWLAEDGELMVRGPQVSPGYYKLDKKDLQQGVLASGDLGSIDAAGHISLYGRKKDILITSYGKNINAQKVEEHLKNISGVSEAVLIGEQKPFCSALIWMDHPVDNLEEKISEMNKGLSHPEQIKKWRVIERPLAISAGELTPNLKVRKNVVMEHYADIIEAMYRK